MDTKEKKRSVVPLTKDYDGESCSAGQDNVGRILTALLSFRRLKEKLGEKYRGGLLLIDEFDATLHPASQIKLVELFRKQVEELSLQVVVTTHSLYLIETCLKKFRKDVGVVHISKRSKRLQIQSKATMEIILADLKNVANLPPKPKRGKKVTVVLEDGEASLLLQYLVKQDDDLKGKITIANIKGKKNPEKATHLSGQYLEIFANNAEKIPELRNVVIVPDGDMQWAKNSKNKNVVSLPGNEPIEVQIYKMLRSLSEDDVFWDNCLGSNYSKIVAIGNDVNLEETEIDGVKHWYKKQKPFWGSRLSTVFKRYVAENKTDCENFLVKFKSIVNQCLQNQPSED